MFTVPTIDQAVQGKITKGRTFVEICTSLALMTEASSITGEEFNRFFEEVRQESW